MFHAQYTQGKKRWNKTINDMHKATKDVSKKAKLLKGFSIVLEQKQQY